MTVDLSQRYPSVDSFLAELKKVLKNNYEVDIRSRVIATTGKVNIAVVVAHEGEVISRSISTGSVGDAIILSGYQIEEKFGIRLECIKDQARAAVHKEITEEGTNAPMREEPSHGIIQEVYSFTSTPNCCADFERDFPEYEFCPRCGEPLDELRCELCKEAVDKGFNYCPGCGDNVSS